MSCRNFLGLPDRRLIFPDQLETQNQVSPASITVPVAGLTGWLNSHRSQQTHIFLVSDTCDK